MKPTKMAFAITKMPNSFEDPNSLSKYVEVKISLSINAILSKALYIELSMDENKELNKLFIVDKILDVVSKMIPP